MVLLKTNPMKLLKHPENNSDNNLITDEKSNPPRGFLESWIMIWHFKSWPIPNYFPQNPQDFLPYWNAHDMAIQIMINSKLFTADFTSDVPIKEDSLNGVTENKFNGENLEKKSDAIKRC